MIERCMDNDFREMKFSYDLLGSPDKIEITVYLNERDRSVRINFLLLSMTASVDCGNKISNN